MECGRLTGIHSSANNSADRTNLDFPALLRVCENRPSGRYLFVWGLLCLVSLIDVIGHTFDFLVIDFSSVFLFFFFFPR